MTLNATLALIGLMLVGGTIATGPTIPADVPWYVHTILSAIQGAAMAMLLIVDPKDLARIRPGTPVAVVEVPPAIPQA